MQEPISIAIDQLGTMYEDLNKYNKFGTLPGKFDKRKRRIEFCLDPIKQSFASEETAKLWKGLNKKMQD